MTIGPSPKFSQSVDEIVSDLQTYPLFMQSLPSDAESNDMVTALQALAFDGTPEENALNFKNQGNEVLQDGNTSECKHRAVQFYTQAIQQNCTDQQLNSVCYSNRAAVNLSLGNYRKVLQDCAIAIELNPTNEKAYFRSAKALFLLERVEEALDCCEKGMRVSPGNSAFEVMQKECKEKQKASDEKAQRVKQREREERNRELRLQQAIRLRGIKIKTKEQAVHRVRLNEEGVLLWPVFFLYPEFKESDFIAEFDEQTCVADHVEVMFSECAPWDTNADYLSHTISVFYEKENGVLKRIDTNKPLLQIISQPDYVVTDGVPSFLLLVESNAFARQFLKDYKLE